MKKRQEMRKRCQALVLAGILGAGTLGSAYTAYAAGPGEMPASVGASAAGGPGETGGSGGTGNVPSASSTSENAKGADQTNPNAWKKVNGVYQMPDGSAIQNVLARGIDVSRWQGEINWSQVAADDVSFVMLGTRSKGAVDPYFHRNIQQASAAGVKVGVYIYSLAVTVEMAEAEADFVLDLIHDYPVSYPVAFDMEDSTQGNLSKEELAAIANAFCKKISDSGYYPIVYANENWLKNKLDMSLMDYPVWVARYSARPSYQNPVMWQATSTGSVKGINGNVDIDFQFKDFSGQIPANTWRTINGKRYYYSNYAKQKNAWAQDSSDWYYMDSEGLASTGWITVSGSRYYLDETTGKMQTGWRQDQGKWYYLDASGALAKGWIQDNGSWYCSDTNGVMQTGWLSEGGKRYYLKGSGVMATGWREMDGAWYYFDGSGAMTTGMIEVNGLHYYMDPSTGRMAAGQTLEIGGAVYEAAADGHLIPQGQEESGSTNQESASDSAGTASGSSGTSSNPIIIPSNGSGNSSSSQNVPEPSAPVTGINGGPGVSSAPSQGQVAAGGKPGG